MTRIEECEKLLSEWKSNKESAKKNGLLELWEHAGAIVAGIELALDIFKRPSNTQMQIDAKACSYCEHYKHNYYKYKYCPVCGQPLHD